MGRSVWHGLFGTGCVGRGVCDGVCVMVCVGREVWPWVFGTR